MRGDSARFLNGLLKALIAVIFQANNAHRAGNSQALKLAHKR